MMELNSRLSDAAAAAAASCRFAGAEAWCSSLLVLPAAVEALGSDLFNVIQHFLFIFRIKEATNIRNKQDFLTHMTKCSSRRHRSSGDMKLFPRKQQC